MIYLLALPGATAKTAGLFVMIGAIAGFIFEVPSGYVSDKIGHKRALVIGRVSLLLSTVCYFVGSDIWIFFIGSIFFSAAVAFASGTNSAFLHETLQSLGRDGEYARIVGKMRSIGFAVPILFILAVSALAEINYQYALGVALIIDVIGLIAILLLTEPVRKVPIDEVDLINFPKALRLYMSLPWIRYVMFGAVGFSVLFTVTVTFKQPYQEHLGISLTALGVLWALSRVFISAVLPFNGKIYEWLTFKQFTIYRNLLFAISFFGVAFFDNKWIVASFFIFGNIFTWGLSPVHSQYLLDYIPNSNLKATMLSINQFIVGIFKAVLSVLVGYSVFYTDYKTTFWIAGAICFLVAILPIIYIKGQDIRKNKAILTP